MRKVVIMLFLFFFNILLVSCDTIGPQVKTENDFVYIVYPERVIIRALSDQGREKSAIYIPLTLSNKPVIGLGQQTTGYYYYLQSSELTHLNLSHNTLGFTTLTGLPNLKTLVLSSVEPVKFTDSNGLLLDNSMDIYVPKGMREAYQRLNQDVIDHIEFKIANISYMYHYVDSPNSGFYRVDFKTLNELLYEPNEPTRTGYTFNGWYTDTLCTILWDFETQLNTDEITLYAKWDKLS